MSDSKRDGGVAQVEYPVPYPRVPIVKVGNRVTKGQIITDGSADIEQIFKIGGKQVAEQYILNEINKVYEVQGASIARKHTEIIIRLMFSRRRITDAGDTALTLGDIVENIEMMEENDRMKQDGGSDAVGDIIILGIAETALRTKSWLSAASFQNTNRILINSAIKGTDDNLRGLKENVIVGRLIPAGTGFNKQGGRN